MHGGGPLVDVRSLAPTRSTLPAWLLAIYALVWGALAVAPVSREDWLLENLLVFAALPLLIASRKRLQLSNLAYSCLFAFFVLHAIGAHYTYSLVPYDRWWQAITGGTLNDALGWRRNHYDRMVHFLYGALMLPAAMDIFRAYAPPRGVWRSILPVAFVMSHSVVYELVEWLAALIVAPELGDAYLGAQGDEWDAQKDMALATAGAALAMLLLKRAHRT